MDEDLRHPRGKSSDPALFSFLVAKNETIDP